MSTVQVLTNHLVVGRVLKDLCVILKRDEQRPESIPRPRKGHFWTALIKVPGALWGWEVKYWLATLLNAALH